MKGSGASLSIIPPEAPSGANFTRGRLLGSSTVESRRRETMTARLTGYDSNGSNTCSTSSQMIVWRDRFLELSKQSTER